MGLILKLRVRDVISLPAYVTVQGLASKCICLHDLHNFVDKVIHAAGKALLNYMELSSLSQKSYQIDEVQYLLALTNTNRIKQSPQRTSMLPVILLDSISESDARVSNNCRRAFEH